MSARRQAQLAMALAAIAALFLIWVGTRRRPWPKPLSDLEVATAWLQCIDCAGSFLERLDKMPTGSEDTVTKYLGSALLNGPDTLRLRQLEENLQTTWQADSLRRALSGEAARPPTQRVRFLERYRQGLGVRWRGRGAIALGVINNPLARAALDSALKLPRNSKADSAIHRIVERAKVSAGGTIVDTAASGVIPTMGLGSVAGRVLDDEGQELAGAQVFIEGTSIAASTRFDGQYRLRRVPAGTRSLRARMIGHRSQSVSIDVIDGKHTKQDLTLLRVVAHPSVPP